jgi:putative hydrolase
MLCDFHTHTFLSDGLLLPMELIRRAHANGYDALGISDHASASNLELVVQQVARDCELAREHWGFTAIPGVELTHVPAASIAALAAKARAAGARYVLVHGESPVEPVEPGTNRAAVECGDVDGLCHPGLISMEEAALAAHNGVFLEVSARKGHCFANGHVARTAEAAGAALLLGSDAHAPEDLLTPEFGLLVLRWAGLSEDAARRVLEDSAREMLQRVGASQ